MLTDVLTRFGYLFYIIDPKSSSFENVESVPDYITEVIPYFVSLIIIEQLIKYWKGSSLARINDSIASLSGGMFMELTKILFNSVTLLYYIYIYENWRLFTIPWDSLKTWVFTMIIVDFGFYWFHRASHEINIIWGAHQVHHSSQEYNLTTSLRQSVLQLYFQAIFYLPLALIIPPQVFLVHNQFNALYQFWIHTEVIKSIGIFEYVLNTPSHHRVHHGRNRYCIDKNYGGVLIIWDRIFGTFEKERDYVSYGLTDNISSFDPLNVQMHHYYNIYQRIKSYNGFRNKLFVLIKGPGWQPGTPRLGNIADIPENEENVKHDPFIPLFYKIYISIHFIILIIFHSYLMTNFQHISGVNLSVSLTFVFASLTSFGYIMDVKKWAEILEIIRCILFILAENLFCVKFDNICNFTVIKTIRIVFLTSIFIIGFRLFNCINKIRTNIKK